jgi:hypothetical protein
VNNERWLRPSTGQRQSSPRPSPAAARRAKASLDTIEPRFVAHRVFLLPRSAARPPWAGFCGLLLHTQAAAANVQRLLVDFERQKRRGCEIKGNHERTTSNHKEPVPWGTTDAGVVIAKLIRLHKSLSCQPSRGRKFPLTERPCRRSLSGVQFHGVVGMLSIFCSPCDRPRR